MRLEIDKAAMESFLDTEKMSEITRAAAQKIVRAAKTIYLARRENPDRTKYLESFRVVKDGRSYLVKNVDPVAFFVEFGVRHEGSGEHILGYAPLRLGVDAVASEV